MLNVSGRSFANTLQRLGLFGYRNAQSEPRDMRVSQRRPHARFRRVLHGPTHIWNTVAAIATAPPICLSACCVAPSPSPGRGRSTDTTHPLNGGVATPTKHHAAETELPPSAHPPLRLAQPTITNARVATARAYASRDPNRRRHGVLLHMHRLRAQRKRDQVGILNTLWGGGCGGPIVALCAICMHA